MMFQHPAGVEFMVKERQRELSNSIRLASLGVQNRQSLSSRMTSFMHELGHWLENLGVWLRRRYQPLTSPDFDCPGSKCRQPCC